MQAQEAQALQTGQMLLPNAWGNASMPFTPGPGGGMGWSGAAPTPCGTRMQITCPDGATTGTFLAIATPDGRCPL